MAQPTTIKSGDPRNDVTPSAPKGYSTFNLSHRFLQTHRFGEITPHCSFETIKGAKDSIRLMNDTSSYSLKAPLKTEMFQKRSNFFVPLQAIIRNNWELLVAQPNSGDDVLPDVDGVVDVSALNNYIRHLLASFDVYSYVDEEGAGAPYFSTYLSNFLKNLLAAEMFLSQGSLCKQLLYDFSHCVHFYEKVGVDSLSQDIYASRSFDRFLEKVLSAIAPTSRTNTGIHQFNVRWYDEDNNVTDHYVVVSDEALGDINLASSIPTISYRHFLDLARQDLNFMIYYVDMSASWDFSVTQDDDENNVYSLSSDYLDAVFGDYWFYNSEDEEFCVNWALDAPLVHDVNFDKVSAYQIVCAHFFSLDHVDYIYSAELFRQLCQYYEDKIIDSDSYKKFSWNGIDLRYDPLSGAILKRCIFSVIPVDSSNIFTLTTAFSFRNCFLTTLFSFRHSLRYLDYFTGGRTQPLSVGSSTDPRANVNVAVNNGAVNGVEMILAQNAARYLNFAQRVGKKISQWLDKMFPGGTPKPDMHDPQWLASTGDALNPEQTQNTGAGQLSDANSITARFKNDSNRYMFTIQPDRPGYIICVTYYDVPRAYAYATDRENLHKDRYDRFNPFLQYNGSQEVYKQELGIKGNTPFSYQGRYEEYKQKYDICAGAFVENLPGFAFVADVQSGLPMVDHLSPKYVRSWNTELDPFYLALTGYGLAGYFHFIVKNVNIINAVRPMEYAPQLM